MGVPLRALGDEVERLEAGRKAFANPLGRVERRAEIRSGDLLPANDDLAALEALPLLTPETRNVRLAVRAQQEQGAGPEDALELAHPPELHVLGQVGEDREGVDEVEAGVLERERRCEAVRLEPGELEVPAAPLDRPRVRVAAGDIDPAQRLPVPSYAAAPAAEVEDRAEVLDPQSLPPERRPDRPRRQPSAAEEPLDVGRARDSDDQLRRWNGEAVCGSSGRGAAAPQRAQTFVAPVGRAEQTQPLEGAAGERFHRARLLPMAKAPVLPRGFELPLEPRLPRIGSVDQVALEERAATLAKRSIKREAKVYALELAIRMMDLTTLEGADTPGKVAALASKAIRPDPSDPGSHRSLRSASIRTSSRRPWSASGGSEVKVASVATAFPSGQSPLDVKLAEVREVVELGADEVDMVIDRGAFLAGRYAKVYDEIVRVKEACGDSSPEGDSRDRRARHVRQRPPRFAARHGCRRGLHQDFDRQAPVGRDAAGRRS